MDDIENAQFEVEIRSSVRVRVNLGLKHMEAAEDFASQCTAIEESQKALDWPQPRLREATKLALGAVVLAVAAMEASINEIYLTAVDDALDEFARAPSRHAHALSERWKKVEQKPILEKHQIALEACGKHPFDEGSEPYQSARDLVQLRDALVHYKSEWDSDAGKHRRLEERLQNRFAESQLWAALRGKRAWFPYRCLGAGCANWACSVVRTLHIQFCARLGTEPVLG